MTIALRTGLLLFALLVAGAASAQSTPAKKELVQRLLQVIQQNVLEAMARSVVEQPAAQMMREAGLALQQRQTPPEKFQAIGNQIEAEVKKYVDEALPIVRDRMIKGAPATFGVAFETKMSEDELRQLLTWLQSPAAKKFQEIAGEARNELVQQVSRDAGPLIQPKLVALDSRIRVILGVPPASGAPTPAARPASR